MLPVMVPMVHEKVLVTSAVNAIFGEVPLQVAAVLGVVTVGVVAVVTTILLLTGGQSVLSVTETV
jgi:hypothetical protein